MRVLVLCAAAAAACGGGGSAPATGSATFTGTIGGQPFAVVDAVSAQVQGTDTSGQTFRNGVVLLSSVPTICAKLSAKKEARNTQYLILFVATFDGSVVDAPKGPGTFAVGAQAAQTSAATGTYFATDATCTVVGSPACATAGAVTLTGTGGTYQGSFNLTFNATDAVTGTFTAPGCPALADLVQSASATACE